MTWKISLLLLLVAFIGCKGEKTAIKAVEQGNSENTAPNYLIEAPALLELAQQPNVRILDFRKPEFYAKEHINGALNIWRTDIEDSTYAYSGMMASKQQLESLFSTLGISTNDTIIIYDDNGLCDASRLWWILQNYDFTNVKLFHGGLEAWKANNGSVSTKVPVVEKTSFKLSNTPSMKYYVSKTQMQQAVTNNILLLDTRTHDEYTGKRQKNGAAKGGRIPNSHWIDWSMAIEYHGNMHIKSMAALEKIYSQINASKNDTIIVYCHSGVRSAHTTFILTQMLGYKNVKNYDGSWSEWSHFNDLPIAQDSITTIIN